MKSKFDLLIISHAKTNIGTFNTLYAYAKAITINSKKKVCLICPNSNNNLFIKYKKNSKNLTIIYLPCYNYHKYFNLQIVRLVYLLGILFFFNYRCILASGFSQPQISIPITIAKVFKNKKVIYIWDDMWGNGLGKKINSVINKIFLLSEKLSFKYCDHIILLSSFFEQKVKKLNIPFTKVYQPYFKKKPINNINLYVKNFKKKYSIHRSDNIIICMGNAFFDTEKIILDTLEKLRIKKIKFKCIFMGKFQISNHNKNKYRKLANKNIINLGFVNDKSLFESVMKMGSLYILPMARDLIEKSRFPVRIYDYINRNKIIVTNATGEMSYIFKKYKIGILTKYSSEYFYRGIIQSLKISKLQKKNIIKNQMKIIKNIFDNKKIAKKLIDIIEQ